MLSKNIIRFVETNVNGCGEDAEVLIIVDDSLCITKEHKEQLVQTILNLKQKLDEYDTDSIITEACKIVFGDVELEVVLPEFEIEF